MAVLQQIALTQNWRVVSRAVQARLIASQKLMDVPQAARLARAGCGHSGGDAMGLLVVFILCLAIGQTLSIFVGLAVERYTSP